MWLGGYITTETHLSNPKTSVLTITAIYTDGE